MKTSNSKVLHINDKINEQEIASEFKNHFDKLLNTPQISIIQSELPAKDDSVINHDMLFSTTDIKSAIKHLHVNKSSDPFLIKSEHFTTISNENLNLWLTSFFNHILNSGKVPEILSTSLIIPLVKSYKKSLSSSDNYRGISLTPILTKILEILLLQKSEIFTETSPSQFGFKKNSSTLHAEFIITETIRYYNQNNTPIYICSLDAQKAFDSCNWTSLFHKLRHEKHLPEKLIKVIQSLYHSGTAQVLYNGNKSEKFNLTQGVRQGSILSPYLYNLYTDALSQEIHELSVGTTIGNLPTGITSYADDIILLSSTHRGLQKMIDTCVNYGYEHGIKFNPTKTQFITSGTIPFSDIQLKMYNSQITPSTTLNHLGFVWKTDSQGKSSINKSHVENRLFKFWAAHAALVTSGIRYLHPYSIRTIFQSIMIPALTYGLELCYLLKHQIEILETQIRRSLKLQFNVSTHSLNLLLPALGINRLSLTIARQKIAVFLRLLKNPFTRTLILYQLNHCKTHNSFAENVLVTCEEQNIDIRNIMVTQKLPYVNPEELMDENVKQKIETVHNYFENWFDLNARKSFRELMEAKIPK